MPYLVSILIPFAPIFLGLVESRTYVDNKFEVHELVVQEKFKDLTSSVDQILELNLAREIRELMIQRCKYPSPALDRQIDRLQREYRKVTKPPQNHSQLDCGLVI